MWTEKMLGGFTIWAAMLAVFALPALAQQVYRCVDESGATVFSDRPCSTSQSERVDITPHQGHQASSPPRPAPFSHDFQADESRFQSPPSGDGRSPATLTGPGPSASDPAIASMLRERNRLIARMRGRGVRDSDRAQLLEQLEDVESRLVFSGFDLDRHRGSSSIQAQDTAVIRSNQARVEAWEERKANPPPPMPNDSITTMPVFDPRAGRWLNPFGPNAIDRETGTIWQRTPTGFRNPETGEQVRDPHRSPP